MFFFGYLLNIQSQNNSFKKKGITFIIKSQHYFNKSLADSLNSNREKIRIKSLNPGDSTKVFFEETPLIGSYNEENLKYFRINPNEYIIFLIKRINDSIINRKNFSSIIKISRDSLIKSYFNLNQYKIQSLGFKEKYRNIISSYQIKHQINEERRSIAGFDCFKLVFENKNKIITMYVTDKISLNYHPIFNDLNVLKKYYPLYIKIVNKKYPKRVFDEYIFSKG